MHFKSSQSFKSITALFIGVTVALGAAACGSNDNANNNNKTSTPTPSSTINALPDMNVTVQIPVGAAGLGTAAYGVNPLVITQGAQWRTRMYAKAAIVQTDACPAIAYIDYLAPNGAVQFQRLVEVK